MKTMKTMKTMKSKLFKILLIFILISSCSKDNPTPISEGLYNDGYFIINEGNYGVGNGSISFVSEDGSVEHDVFYSNNLFQLGDVVQSMKIINDFAYIIVNNSSKIEVATADSILYVSTIPLSSPRYIAQVSENKAYVTDWGINGVQVIDLNTNSVTSTISCGNGPEGIVVSNGYAYICNSGGWGFDNTVTIINIENDMVETTLTVGDKPSSAVVDYNGDVWVLSSGNTEYDADWNIINETAGSLVRISNNSIVDSYDFTVGNHPSDLVINDEGSTLYYSDGGWSKQVYSFDINQTVLSNTSIINRSFYSIAYNNGYIYGADAVNFSDQGWSYRYNSNGVIVDSVQTGIIPGNYCFTE